MIYFCEECGEECEEVYIVLKTGEKLCSDCYFEDEDEDEDFDDRG